MQMSEPYISPAFDMEDIRRIRDYNSARHSKMTHAEIIEDNRKGAEEMIKRIAKYKLGTEKPNTNSPAEPMS